VSDTLYLCATTRLAQTLRSQQPEGACVWRTVRALTIGQWLGALADEALLCGIDVPVALDAYGERLLWEQIIAEALSEASPLFDLPGMAASAADAHALCRVWNLSPAGEALSDEARLFAGWQSAFVERCRTAGWLDLAGVQQALLGEIEAGCFSLPTRIVFAGFDRLTPFELRLQQALQARGVAVENGLLPAVDRGQAAVLACADSRAECAAVVAWAQAHLAANPACRLGVVAPDLAGVRDCLEFMLDDALHPGWLRPDAAEVPRSFNFSLGRPLAELPLIRVALDLLALGGGRARIEQAHFSRLLLAGGWSVSESEADGRACLDAAMRRDLAYFTSLSALLRLAERLAERGTDLCPRSVAALKGLAEVLAATPRLLRPSEWAAVFRQALHAVGWPGERPLSSHEFQSHRAFGEVLDALARLDALLGTVPLPMAVRRLRELARQRIFQPETRGQPSIQVLGVLESAGLQFDALWVMGMNDDLWPPAPRPNPLLPAPLLRAAGASHASAEVELDFARRVHERLLTSAPSVLFSHARADGNRLLRPSPLIAGLPLAEAIPAHAAMPQPSFGDCELIEDAQAPAVMAGEKVSGGSWVLRAQAICPAWAYYQYRLGAEAMEEPVEGLDPAARGTLVHGALEAFWTTVRSSQALAALGERDLQMAVAQAVEQALEVFERERRSPLPVRFRQLEAARLQRLLTVWLDVEARRGQPFTVVACEAPAEVEIEGIRVRMFVDRIDQLDDGRQVIIDYKTGQSIDVKNWAEERITEPQLPIYAALVADDVSAVVFAKVLLDKPAFAGVADAEDVLPGVQGLGEEKQKIFAPERFPDWPSVVEHWRARLLAIAGEVRGGVAGVVLADEKALKYCDVLPILRLPERRRLLAEQASGVVQGNVQ
jgi:exodeoxyribonuclease-5